MGIYNPRGRQGERQGQKIETSNSNVYAVDQYGHRLYSVMGRGDNRSTGLNGRTVYHNGVEQFKGTRKACIEYCNTYSHMDYVIVALVARDGASYDEQIRREQKRADEKNREYQEQKRRNAAEKKARQEAYLKEKKRREEEKKKKIAEKKARQEAYLKEKKRREEEKKKKIAENKARQEAYLKEKNQKENELKKHKLDNIKRETKDKLNFSTSKDNQKQVNINNLNFQKRITDIIGKYNLLIKEKLLNHDFGKGKEVYIHKLNNEPESYNILFEVNHINSFHKHYYITNLEKNKYYIGSKGKNNTYYFDKNNIISK